MAETRSLPGAEQLSSLAELARTRQGREEVEAAFPGREQIAACLKDPSPKVRKNASRVLGALGHPEDSPALAAALEAENTLYVIPSLLLALGNTRGDAAETALRAYRVPESPDPESGVHIERIRAALTRACAFFQKDSPLPPYEPPEGCSCLLMPPQGFSDQLFSELASRGIAFEPVGPYASVRADRLDPLYQVRCAEELLLPLAIGVPLLPQKIAAAAAESIRVPYRIELRNYPGNRVRFLRQLVSEIGGENNPSRYRLELRVVCRGRQCDLFLKPWPDGDPRFSYRGSVLPASIAAPAAACLARYAVSFAPAGPVRILDPFCGSGTLLIECGMLRPDAVLTGVDLSAAAVLAARSNALAAGVRLRVHKKNVLQFLPEKKADILLSNMPFGNRVGSHASNTELYRSFVRRLDLFLAPEGTAVLYTTESRLLSECVSASGIFSVEDIRRTSAGGLLPWVFTVRRVHPERR